MKRTIVFLYGFIAYLLGLASLTYWVGFMADFHFLPKTINSGVAASLPEALLINLGLMLLFGFQHGIMARKSFKTSLTKFIPQAAERSTFVLASAVCLIAIMAFWRPIPATVWHVESGAFSAVLLGIFYLGWALLFGGSFVINHFELFGLQQIYFNLRGKEFVDIKFKQPFLYKIVRHPMMLGVTLAIWSTPYMTVSHLFFSLLMSLYLLVGLYYEERDLVARYGDRYRTYSEQVPRLFPKLTKKEQTQTA